MFKNVLDGSRRNVPECFLAPRSRQALPAVGRLWPSDDDDGDDDLDDDDDGGYSKKMRQRYELWKTRAEACSQSCQSGPS